jgi:hypothetical protein
LDQYLIHYWPLTNGQLNDVVGNEDMFQGNLTNFVPDRFGCANSALNLNGEGWIQVPSGIYFNPPEFTITVWIYPQQNIRNGSWASIIDFGNGPGQDEIILGLSFFKDNNQTFLGQIFNGSNQLVILLSPQHFSISRWQFLATSYNGTHTLVYINGQLVLDSLDSLIQSVTRTNCFIGKSNWAGHGLSSSYLDELRFYNKSLTEIEILQLMNQNETSE